ncbi:hypothetical protein C8D76_10357 [Pasteurella langaaensis DSM 22999]|uniref:Restriction endonuclease n=1 Tax=Alitibacter langaaensis DSM 22999 TaxID=1122935 RepID=A0A2U0TA77_9PAST|nr:restriction endonuclease [Pasteurella langaaensis]PVX40488.1 hypothetical protein C8D76_10357 [Pasteurella langaaensis DSM 22999]
MQTTDIENFLNKSDYDVRKTGNARWIDQKCTHDVLCIIADCIDEFIQDDTTKIFTVKDIWNSEYAKDNVIDIFSKPDVNNKKAQNEYDKFFGQPIKLLAYSKILTETKKDNRYIYTINHLELLQYIAMREQNALNFLYLYITKVLKDSGLHAEFDAFFNTQTTNSFYQIKKYFSDFTIKYTKINGGTECGRIFTKILNPLAFKLKKKGTIKGYLSKNTILLSDLQYNRLNWRDELSGKDKALTRNEYKPELAETKTEKMALYAINKAKKAVRKYNDKFNIGLSEIKFITEKVKATQIHHIFPQNEFPTIADFIENLIAITPNQHFSMAHPSNQTRYIDKDFQYICLISKTNTIRESILVKKDDFYHFNDYQYLPNTGLNTDEFSLISNLDFGALLSKIDEFYSPLEENKYISLLPK